MATNDVKSLQCRVKDSTQPVKLDPKYFGLVLGQLLVSAKKGSENSLKKGSEIQPCVSFGGGICPLVCYRADSKKHPQFIIELQDTEIRRKFCAQNGDYKPYT